MRDCPSKEILIRYAENRCSPEEFDTVDTHIYECEKCRKVIQSHGVYSGDESANVGTFAPSLEITQASAFNTTADATRVVTQHKREPPPPVSKREDVSRVFENYTILEELPRGGQAAVYKALHEPTKTTVAIKVLLPGLLASRRARYYFEREAEVIAFLNHPNIVRIRDSGIIHGQYFFVMEYIDGKPLDQYTESEELSVRERAVLFGKICSAVSHAHQQGIIHRDLKFANILVDAQGEPHILDFGIAKAVGMNELAQKEAMPTMTGQWSGSLSNMSPEQASGMPGLIDMRTDVYALGGMLYYLLTGRHPYDISGPTFQVLQNIQQNEPIRPRTIDKKFDSDLEAILLTALAKDKEQRYQSVADLKADIDNWLEGRPIRVRSISTWYVLRKIIVRHRYASAVILLLLLIIMSFSYVSFDFYLSARKAQNERSAISSQWSREGSELTTMTQQAMPMAFARFLQAWRDGRNRDAQAMALYFSRNSREFKGAVYLLRLTQNGPGAIESGLDEQDRWLGDFLLAEHQMKYGSPEKAFEAYQRSRQVLQHLPDAEKTDLEKFLESLIKAGLYEYANLPGSKPPENP